MTRPVRSHFAVGSLVFKWAGRISALVLLVLWSLFFGKHVHEW